MRNTIGQHLIRRGLITEEQLNIALEQQKRAHAEGRALFIGEIIVRNSFATRKDVSKVISDMKASDTGTFTALDLPANLCKKLGIVVLGLEGETLRVASINALTPAAKQELVQASSVLGVVVREVVTEFRDRMEVMMELGKLSYVDFQTLKRDISAFNRDPANGLLLQTIIRNLFIDALQSRASDLHIDNVQDSLSCWISYRIDGDLRHRYLLSPEAMSALTTRLKGEAGLDFSEKQRAQDGRMEVEYNKRNIDIRVAVIPVDNGETIAIRLLDEGNMLTLDDLMVHHPKVLERLKTVADIKSKTGGLILVTGPTGSGKSTTLYGFIRHMPRHKLNIMTAEDPIEYRLPGIRQTPVNRLTGMNYANILVAQLRQDPDVLVIGEMRDPETVEAALRSVESGHMVLSTLHTSDVIQGIVRLANMMPDEYRGSGLFVIANFLKVIMNQRLTRKLCSCAAPYRAAEVREHYGILLDKCRISDQETLFRVSGCPICDETGYFGRVLAPEFIYFPQHRELRLQMESLISGRGGESLSGLLDLEGVEYYPRYEAIAELLRNALIDIESAASLLGLDILRLGAPAGKVTNPQRQP